jgi:uncharacterized alpha-E superfamily protein
MLCRVADEMFWMSRYVERAVAVARLIEYTWQLELDAGDPNQDDAGLWAPLLGTDDEQGFLPLDDPASATPPEVRYRLAFDDENQNSLLCCVRQARAAARGVRESISTEMWEQLNTLYLSLVDPSLAALAEEDPHAFYSRVRQGAQLFQGLADCTLAHDEPWHFITLGKYLERADDVARVLKLQSHLLLGADNPTGDELVRWLAVLRSCGSAEAYARFYSLRIEPARVIEFLVLNPVFPQSIRFSLGAAAEALGQIDSYRARAGDDPGPASRQLGRLRARLEYGMIDEIMAVGLRATLTEVQNGIAEVSEQITRSHFQDEPRPNRLVTVSRAAMIMAAQQQ